MTRAPSNSARTVAFAVAFGALALAAGCGQETFDLLPGSAPLRAGAPAGGAGGANLGGGGSARGGAPGSGTGGAGGPSKAGASGFAGHFGPPGGSSGSSPCLGEGGCPDEEPPICSKIDPFPFCIPCEMQSDCMPPVGDAKLCDPVHKRCVECINEFQCGFGEACNPLNQRCAKACGGNNNNCTVDGQHLICSRELGVCVYCIKDTDCDNYGYQHCSQSVCVECTEEFPCMAAGQACLRGRCVKL